MSRAVLQALLMMISLATRPGFSSQDGKNEVPPRVIELLEYLSALAPAFPTEGKPLVPRKPIDADVFLGYVSSKGILFTSVDGEPPLGQVTREQLRKELKNRRGPGFRYVVHLAYTLRPPLNVSALTYKKDKDKEVLTTNEYDLEFCQEGSGLKLVRVASTDPYGD
jgi:hypothetical protein